jgi:hypothetical protein
MCVKSFCSCIPSTVWPLVSNWQGKFMLTSREVGLLDNTWWAQILRCLPLNLLRLSGNPIINSTSHYRKKTVATMPTVCSLFLMISWMLYYIRNFWQYIPLWALKQNEWWPTIWFYMSCTCGLSLAWILGGLRYKYVPRRQLLWSLTKCFGIYPVALLGWESCVCERETLGCCLDCWWSWGENLMN